MLLYVYADVLSLFRPGQVEEMSEGRMGPVEATQATLLLAATIVVVPTVIHRLVRVEVAPFVKAAIGARSPQ